MANGEKQGSGGDRTMTVFWVVLALAALLLVVFLRNGKSSSQGASAGLIPQDKREAAPEFDLAQAGGSGQITQKDTAGKVTILHFWATWCPPCRAEFPEFAKYALAIRENPKVAVLPVSLDESPSVVPGFVQKYGNGIAAYTDGGKLEDAMGVASIPETILLDKSGRVAFKSVGGQEWSENGIGKLVEELADE